MLVLVGGSKPGKTELAKDFKGPAQTLVVDCQHAAHPDLREFDPSKHQAVVMDDIAGSDFVLANKKLLQAHADGAKLGQSPTQTLAYEVFLWRVPVVVTTNHWSAAHHDAVDQEWLAKNCVVEEIAEKVHCRDSKSHRVGRRISVAQWPHRCVCGVRSVGRPVCRRHGPGSGG